MYTNRRASLALLAALTAGLLSACGSNRNAGPQPPANQAPQVQGLTAQSIPQDTSTEPLAFQVSDPDSSADALTVTAESADLNLIPAEGVVLGGSGANRTIQITPAPDAIGSTAVTVVVKDPAGLIAQQTFGIQVNGVFVSFRGVTNEIFEATEDGEPRTLSGVTFTPDADDDPAAFDALLR